MEGSVLGDYRLLSRLGEGAAGVVFLATPLRPKNFANPGDPLAIKVYREEILRKPRQLERIQREFKIGSQIAHPNVVRIYDYSVESRPPYLVMEYVDGITLEQLGGMFYPIPDKLLVHLLRQLARGLLALHSGGIIHRDIKPENIMVSSSFQPKIMDLGVVKPPSDEKGITPPDKFLGTIRNAAPEYLFDDRSTESSDLYSFGTALYFLLHGHQVFAEENHFARLIELVKRELPPVDEALEKQGGIPKQLLDLCKLLLQKIPEERRTTTQELVRNLDAAQKMIVSPLEEPIHAYLATALTGLNRDAREAIAFVGARIADVCKAFDIFVYQPRKATDPVRHRDISPGAVYLLDRRRVTAAGFLIVLGNYPSFGVGQELEIAASYGKPTLLIRHEDITSSRMVTGSYANFIGEEITYSYPEELDRKLKRWLQAHLETIQSWLAVYRKSIPQELFLRLTEIREVAEYSIDQAAEKIGLSPAMLEGLERQPLSFHNVGLQTLYRLCYLFGADIRELLSPGPIRSGPAPDDPNLRELEKIAVRANWSASDYLALRREYEKEIAGRESPIIIGRDGWMNRHEALQRRRLNGKTEP